MDQLKEFYENEAMREQVRLYFLKHLQEVAIEKAFKGEDIKGMPEAKTMIDRAFVKLDGLYSKKAKPKTENQAR